MRVLFAMISEMIPNAGKNKTYGSLDDQLEAIHAAVANKGNIHFYINNFFFLLVQLKKCQKESLKNSKNIFHYLIF